MEAVLEKYKYLFRTPRPNTLMERELYDTKVSMLQRCSKYCQIMQQEPVDQNFIEMLTEQIYARIRVINLIQHYIDTEYIR